MLKLKKSYIVPPGGWRFVDPVDNYVCPIGGTWADTKARARAHRKANDIPIPDDFDAIMEDWLCRQIPESFSVGTMADGQQNNSLPPIQTVQNKTKWLSDQARKHGGKILVTPDEANRRAKICYECPENAPIACLSCYGVYDWMEQSYGMGPTTYDATLQVCRVDKVFNKAQCWLIPEVFTAALTGDPLHRASRYPEKCWKRWLLIASELEVLPHG